MAEAERQPYERPEDLGEREAGHGGASTSPGAGARGAEESTGRQRVPEGHHRVLTGADTSAGIMTPQDVMEAMGERAEQPPPEDVSDEEFHDAVEGLQQERLREEHTEE